MAQKLAGEKTWKNKYDFSLKLFKTAADIEYLNGNFEASEKIIQTLLQNAKTPAEKAEIYFMLMQNQNNTTRYYEAIDSARQGLKLLDFTFPEKDDCPALIQGEMGKIIGYFTEHGVDSVFKKPDMTDERMLSIISILDNLSPPTYVTGETNMWILHVLYKINITIEFGLTPQGGYAFSELGIILFLLGIYPFAYPVAQMCRRITEKFKKESPRHLCRAGHLYTNYNLPWVKHIKETATLNPQYYQISVDCGELVYAGYTNFYPYYTDFFMGKESLDTLLKRIPDGLEYNKKINHDLAWDSLRALQLTMSNLAGRTTDGNNFDIENLSEAELLTYCNEKKEFFGLTMFYLFKAHSLYLQNEFKASMECQKVVLTLVGVLAGSAITSSLFNMIHSLTLLELINDEPEKAEENWKIIEANQAQIKLWSDNNASNFEHKYLLIAAEIDRVKGNTLTAVENYNRAIASAEENEFERELALCHEKAGEFWLSQKNAMYAQPHLEKARYIYEQLGYKRLVEKLDKKYSYIFSTGVKRGGTQSLTTTGTYTTSISAFDVQSVMKASRALSEEIVLDNLLEVMMSIVIENAGAQTGCFALQKDNEWYIQAKGTVDMKTETSFEPIPVLGSGLLAESILNYVITTKENVVLSDATADKKFSNDAYIVSHKPKSVLCAPIINQGKLSGILYLENNLTNGAFTPECMQFLNMLSGQIAVSLENSIMYDNLEQRVEERTAELNNSLQELKITQQQLIQQEKLASLGQLTAGIAHEIKNPLNFVCNFSDTAVEMLDELAGTNEEAERQSLINMLKESMTKISHHGHRADSIVKSMLDHSRAVSSEKEEINVNDLTEEFFNLAYHGARANISDFNCELVKKFDKKVPLMKLIPQEFSRVLLNLFNNAFYAVNERNKNAGDDYNPMVSVSTKVEKSNVIIRVTDNGNGIPAKVKEKIFEPFFTTKPTGLGTGLGLSLSYDIVKAHGGTITVESKEGEGTEFTITIPV